MKTNNDINILKWMAKLGMSFDCASEKELADVLSCGTPAENIIFAQPCKMKSHLQFAVDNNVNLMTFDSVGELMKIKQ
jgi:ornithine decarboxylase